MATSAVRARCKDRIGRMARAGLDADVLRCEVISELRRAIGFDAWCWPLLDPQASLATLGLGEIPHWSGLPRVMELRESGTDEFSELVRPGGRQVAVLSQATGGDLARSAEWREVIGPAGLGDEMRTAFVDAGRPWAQLHIFRCAHDRPFGDDDAQLMREIDQPVASALRRALVQPPAPTRAGDLPVGVLVIDRSLRATAQTPATARWLELLQPASVRYVNAIPASAFQVAARARYQARQQRAGQPEAACRARLRTRDGRWVVMEGQPLDDRGDSVVVTLRHAAPRDVFDLMCLGYRLSAREVDVAALVVQGLDTAGIARRLFLSEYTVNDHIRSIFTKTGVHSRRELLAAIA